MGQFQDLGKFTLPAGFRGRSAWLAQLWWLVQGTLFGLSPQMFYGWRRFLLRCFGARIGRDVLLRPSVRVTYPWKVTIGDRAWIGDHAVLYSLGEIVIGQDSVISQRCYLCTGNHDFTRADFPIFAQPVVVGTECWLATDVFVAPGVTIGDRAVVGARSSVFTDLPGAYVYHGTPARPVRPRIMEGHRQGVGRVAAER